MEKKKNVLVYCGTNNGEGFLNTIRSRNWDHIYGFEANPTLYKKVKDQFAMDHRVKMYNTILSNSHGEEKDFYILDANGSGHDYSSSVVNKSDWLPEYESMSGNRIELKRVVKLKTTNLNIFLHEESITEIDFLLTDLEGSDLLVITTIKDWISEGKIKKIQCEVEPDSMPCKYVKLDNKFSGFNELVKKNYNLIAKYQDIPGYFCVDHVWGLKNDKN